MDLGTALEICGNPYDLHFCITKRPSRENGEEWDCSVGRGPGHRGKVLLTLDGPLYPSSRDGTLWLIEAGVLYMALLGAVVPEGSASIEKINAAEGKEAKRATIREAIEQEEPLNEGCLTLEIVDRIMAALAEKNEYVTTGLGLAEDPVPG